MISHLVSPFTQSAIDNHKRWFGRVLRSIIFQNAGEEGDDGGLSDFGRTAIAEMNRLGIIVDVAHSGWRTSLEAAKASKKPMVASHTACATLHKHYLGKPDEIIKAICDSGGLLGIGCIPKFLGGKGDINAMLHHIDYALKTFAKIMTRLEQMWRMFLATNRRNAIKSQPVLAMAQKQLVGKACGHHLTFTNRQPPSKACHGPISLSLPWAWSNEVNSTQ